MRALRVFWIASALAIAAGIGLSPAIAQQASVRPITLVVAWPTGNATDAVGRLLATNMESQLGQKVIVENRPGAGGYAGSAYVARAAPNGQTLLMGTFTQLNASVFAKGLELDMVRELVPIAILAVGPQFLFASGTLPVKNLPEFVAYAKKNPKKLNAAVFSNSTGVLYTLMFLQAAGIDMVAIPYNAQPVTDMLTGEVHLFLSTIGFWKPHIASGKVVALAVVTPERAELLPETPSVKEQGINFEAPPVILAVFGPLGLNPELMGQLNKRMYAAMKTPAVAENLRAQGLSLPKVPETPEELAAKFAKEVKYVRDAAAQFGIKPQ